MSLSFNYLWYKEIKGLSFFSSSHICVLFKIVQQIIKDGYGRISCIPLFRLLLSTNILVH